MQPPLHINPPSPFAKTTTPPTTCVVHAWLTSAVYQQLKNEAARLGMHPDRLSAELLNSVLQNGIVDAIVHRPMGSRPL